MITVIKEINYKINYQYSEKDPTVLNIMYNVMYVNESLILGCYNRWSDKIKISKMDLLIDLFVNLSFFIAQFNIQTDVTF